MKFLCLSLSLTHTEGEVGEGGRSVAAGEHFSLLLFFAKCQRVERRSSGGGE